MLMPPPSPQVETGWRTRHRRCPPHLPCSFFLNGFAPPPPSFARGPVKGGGVACPLSFDSTFSSSLSLSSSSSWALTYYVVAIATSLDAPAPLLLRCRLFRHAAATIVAPMPVSLRLSRASGWLLHRHLSCRASASLVVPAPLLLCRCLSRCAAASLVAPHLRRLVVASPTILTCRRLSCRAGWLLPCYLSLCAAVSLFATSLIAPPSL
jgi:hypothetical protein